MPVATILKNKLSQKKIMMIAASVGIPLVLAGIIAAFFLLQGTATNANEEAPVNVVASPLDASNVQITFQTGKDVLSVVEYGTSPDALTEVSFADLETTDHTFQISGLDPNTTYFFQIRSGDTVYDDAGMPWSFTTVGDVAAPAPQDDVLPTLSIGTSPAEISVAPTPTMQLAPSASPSATIIPTISVIPTPTATISATMTPVAANVCKSNNCVSILAYLGTQCSTQDYVKCIQNVNITITQGPTNTPTPSPISSAIKSSCGLGYMQPNSCKAWTWDDITTKSKQCADTFTQYFVQCKSTAWGSSDPATWFCNQTVSSNQLNLPCAGAPTPATGQSVFCRVRAESPLGGDENATNWVYASTSCPRITGDDPNCSIEYVQANSCTSWIWDFDYQKDPRCADKFNHYFMQCTDDGNFNSSSFWYCNMTTENHYNDLPCYNAAIPGDGMPITCRVRAEDGYGVDSHVSSWTTGSAVCPTSTPTPTPSPTETPTPTP